MTALGLIWFIVGTVLFGNVMAGVIAVILGKRLFRSGRKLLERMRENRELPGRRVSDPREAQDVTVEPIPDEQMSSKKGRPQAPEGVGYSSQPRQTQNQGAQQTWQTSQQVWEVPQPRTPGARPSTSTETRDYIRLDVDNGADEAAICEVMRAYTSDDLLGARARAVIDTLGSAQRRRKILFAELDGTFHEGTLSWDKFAGPAYAAYDAILRNSALLANRIQAFDTAGYRRLEDTMRTGGKNGVNTSVSETRERRWKLYQEMLASLDALQETNESLLLELDALTAEVSSITSTSTGDRGDQIIEEIHRLVEEAKYYRDS